MANLIQCGGCDSPVSGAAAACPKCGHPISATQAPAPAPKPAAKSHTGRNILLILVALGVIGSVLANEDKKKKRDEVAHPSLEAEIVDVTATQLQKDYEANEVSADAKYKDKILRVSGAVEAIKKDFSDDPYVVLKTASMFMGAHASFVDEKSLGSLRVGQKIVARCRGANVIIGSPILKDCVVE